METSSKSTMSSPLAQTVEANIRAIKKRMRKMNRLLNRMDTEGGQHLEIVYQDISHLRKEFDFSIKQTKQALTRFLAELETKMEKLELKVVKLEVAAEPSSSSRHGGKAY